MSDNKKDPSIILKQYYKEALLNGEYLNYKLNMIDYYNVLFKAIKLNKLYNILDSELCLFKYKKDDEDSVFMIFSIPTQSNSCEKVQKHLSEKVMNIIKILEDTFITIKYMNLKEIKEDKRTYLNVII